ncbi:outer membrane beta-barrel protein [Vibrio cholerae]
MNRLWIIGLAALACTVNAESNESSELRPTLSIKTGYQFADDDAYQYIDPRSAVFGISAGLKFNPQWSVDLGYQYQNDLYAKKTQVNVKTWLIESALRYDYHVSDVASLYTRLGVGYWDMEKTASGTSVSATGLSPLGEFGLAYQVNRSVEIAASYQYVYEIGNIHTGEYNSHMALLSATYIF